MYSMLLIPTVIAATRVAPNVHYYHHKMISVIIFTFWLNCFKVWIHISFNLKCFLISKNIFQAMNTSSFLLHSSYLVETPSPCPFPYLSTKLSQNLSPFIQVLVSCFIIHCLLRKTTDRKLVYVSVDKIPMQV